MVGRETGLRDALSALLELAMLSPGCRRGKLHFTVRNIQKAPTTPEGRWYLGTNRQLLYMFIDFYTLYEVAYAAGV